MLLENVHEERKNVGFRKGGSQPLALRLSVANGRDQILRVTRSRIYLRQRIEVKNRIRNTKLKKKKRKGEGEGEGKEIEMQNKEAGPCGERRRYWYSW
jgi:hypothetical protein